MTAARPDLAVASAASKASRSLRSDSPALSDACALTQIRIQWLDSAEGFEAVLQNCVLDRDEWLNMPHSLWLYSAKQTFWSDWLHAKSMCCIAAQIPGSSQNARFTSDACLHVDWTVDTRYA
jgi:hypothetical protein